MEKATIFKDDSFRYVCRSYRTRDGFSHTCRVFRAWGGFCGRWRCVYYNRTWESYRFESVINKARAALGIPEGTPAPRELLG